jgi:hypothetical protein
LDGDLKWVFRRTAVSSKRQKTVEMNKLLFLFLCTSFLSYSQKTAEQIAEQLKPEKSTIVHSVIQQNIWGNKNAIIAFYETRYIDSLSSKQKYERQYIEAYLLIPEKDDYKKVLINKFEDDNVDTEIRSVFFANADKDAEKELIIISTVTHRLQYLYDGTEYSTLVFDNFEVNKTPLELDILYEISEKLSGGFEGYVDAEGNKKAKIKNAEEVKKKLKKLGY